MPKKPSVKSKLKSFAVWHAGASPEIILGYSAIVKSSPPQVSIDQGEGKFRIIPGTVMVTEPTDKIKFL